MVDSDQLFKELLKTFFVEFLELFFSELLAYMDIASIEFPDKEYFTEMLTGERRAADIIAKVKFTEREVFFLIHIENQGDIKSQKAFQQREFFYAADLHKQTGLPVYSIAVLYGDNPRRPHQGIYRIEFPDHVAIEFSYRVVQLNQFDWRDFVAHDNPVAAALMSKMRIAPAERPVVKAACLRMLVGLALTQVERHLIGGFVDTYLKLNEREQETFEREVAKIEPKRRKRTMEIITSWEQKGIKIGEARGKREGKREGKQQEALKLLFRLLRQRVGVIPSDIRHRLEVMPLAQIEKLFDTMLKFSTIEELNAWLEKEA